MITVKQLKNDYDWVEAFSACNVDPCLPDANINCSEVGIDMVIRVVAADPGENDGAHWVGIFELNDGRFISISAWCDYTGWDCRGGGIIFVGGTEEEIIRFGTDLDARRRLNLLLPDEV